MGLAPLGAFVASFPPYTWLFVNSDMNRGLHVRVTSVRGPVRFVLETCAEEEIADREARVGAAQVEIAANLGRLSAASWF